MTSNSKKDIKAHEGFKKIEVRAIERNEKDDLHIARVALDGCCRVGKGEQLAALYAYFTSKGVPTMILKGDGTRMGAGQEWHDLGSRYWTHRHDFHSGMHTPKEEWDIDAFMLARENRVWLEALEKISRISRSCFAIAIYDRSIISRATLAMQRAGISEGNLTEEQMWPDHLQKSGEEITYEESQPEVLFNLTAPQPVLRGRISQNDIDRAFRFRAVHEYYDDFLKAKEVLPISTKTQIIDLDGEAPIKVLTKQILKYLSQIYPDVKELEGVKAMYPEYSENKA
jgi:hypothetical protein